MSGIHLKHQPPSNGWLTLQLSVDGRTFDIDASDVPNNPVQELLAAIDRATNGDQSSVWWHLEPDGYFMRFEPVGREVEFSLEFAPHSERSRTRLVLSTRGSRREVLLPFWRFLRDFQSHSYQEPHWPPVDFGRIHVVKAQLAPENEA